MPDANELMRRCLAADASVQPWVASRLWWDNCDTVHGLHELWHIAEQAMGRDHPGADNLRAGLIAAGYDPQLASNLSRSVQTIWKNKSGNNRKAWRRE